MVSNNNNNSWSTAKFYFALAMNVPSYTEFIWVLEMTTKMCRKQNNAWLIKYSRLPLPQSPKTMKIHFGIKEVWDIRNWKETERWCIENSTNFVTKTLWLIRYFEITKFEITKVTCNIFSYSLYNMNGFVNKNGMK